MPRKGRNIFKREDGRFESCQIKVHKGKKAEAVSQLDTVQSQLKKQKRAKSPNFENIARQWLEELKPIRKKSTIVKYMSQLKNYIIPAFGNFNLNDISNEDIISFCNKLLTEGRNGQKLSPKTVSDIFSRMKSIRRFALLRGYEVNYIPNVVEIPLRQRQIRILTIFEENKILRYLKSHFDLTALGILLSLFTGLRIGELCALKWRDFSFEDKEFYVQRTMQRLHNLDDDTERKTTIEIGEPKSQSSIRKIPIPDELLNFLKNAYVAVSADRQEDAYVLSGLKNKFVEPRTMENRFKSVLKKCGVEKINFHALRHTFATKCVELGFDIKSLSEILGHANVNITLNRYVHPSMKLKHANMNKLNSFICSQNSYFGDAE